MLLDELRALITRHAREDETTAIDGALVSVAEEPAAPTASTSGTVVALIAQGAKRLVLGDRVLDYRAGQYLVASVDLPVTGQFTEASPTEPALGFGLTLRPSVIAELLLVRVRGLHPSMRVWRFSCLRLASPGTRFTRLTSTPRWPPSTPGTPTWHGSDHDEHEKTSGGSPGRLNDRLPPLT